VDKNGIIKMMKKGRIKNYCGFLAQRILATWIDLGLVFAVAVLFLMVIFWSYNQGGWLHQLAENFCKKEEPLLFLNACVKKISPWVIFSTGYLTAMLLSWIYGIIMIVWKRRTLGKIIFSLEVVRKNDDKPGLYTLISREIIGRLVSFIFPFLQLAIFSPSGLTIVDKILGLKVRRQK